MPKTDLILLAMEQSSTLDLLERALRAGNYGLAVAKNPMALEKCLQETIPTLLVISEKLGDKSGLDLAKTTLERFPTLPIILYSVNHDPKNVL